ncbi:MAG: hypothetical protein V4578_01920 [Pseudomonadota bacterium]
MHQASILRQVTLVSYGTKFLRNELDLEDWSRHSVFSGARLQFRESAGNALLADDFIVWLRRLKQSGAVRLSLHLMAEFDSKLPCAVQGGDYAVVAHYADHYQIWAVGEQWAAWGKHPAGAGEAAYRLAVPDAPGSGGDVDCYCCVEDRQGRLEVATTDWRELAAAIAADLDINVPSSLVPVGPVFSSVAEQPAWAKLPLFPSSPVASLAHRVLATLYREQATLANDLNPKNEGSYYKDLDDAGAAQVHDRGERLASWLIEVQLRCANEDRGTVSQRDHTPLRRLHTPRRPAPRGQDERPPCAGPAPAPAPAPEPQSSHKWMARIAFAAACLLMLAFAGRRW